MPPVLVLDWDHTIFDTDQFFHIDARALLARFKITDEIWEKSSNLAIERGYTLSAHIDVLQEMTSSAFSLAEIKSIVDNRFSNLDRYVYPDIRPLLERAQRLGFLIFLASFGHPEWQDFKVERSGLKHYFYKRLYTFNHGDKASEIKKFCTNASAVYVVDNKASELDHVKDLMPYAYTLHINRVPKSMMNPRSDYDRRRFYEARKIAAIQGRPLHFPCSTLDFLFTS